MPDELRESSGLLVYNNLIWTFNDSGGKPIIYGYDLKKDTIRQTITFVHAKNQDWEDIAQDDQYIYVGDFGNNAGARDSLVIYRLSKRLVPDSGDTALIPDKIIYTYPNYTSRKISLPWSAYDCEAMVCNGDSIDIFTKDWTNGTTTIYSLPKNPGKYIARRLTSFDSEGLVTGADYRNDTLALIGYRNFIPFLWIFPDQKNFALLKKKMGRRIELTGLESYQTEGISITGTDSIVISSEATRSPAQMIEIKLNLGK